MLIVDDQSAICTLAADILGEAGCRVIEGEHRPSGLHPRGAAPRADLLITDVGLPGGVNNRQVADVVRPAWPVPKVLFITGYAENAMLYHGHLDRRMHVLAKPFAVRMLICRVGAILEA